MPLVPPWPATRHIWAATAYGGPEVLDLRQQTMPCLGPADIGIQIQATTISAADSRIRAMRMPEGFGMMGRVMFGLRRPRQPVLGVELTGLVCAVGARVTRFVPGDAVIALPGIRMGAHGSHIVMRESGLLVKRPPSMGLDDAAALGFGGMTARDYLRRAKLVAGERLLVIGASGTVGSALVQLGASQGARVTAVTSTANLDLARRLGAADVIDYTRHDLRASGGTWDIVADAVGALDARDAWPLLAERGRYLAIAGNLRDMLSRPRGTRRMIAGPATERLEDLAALVDLVAAGRFRPLIDSRFAFSDLPAAHARADSGRKRGSVIVTMT